MISDENSSINEKTGDVDLLSEIIEDTKREIFGVLSDWYFQVPESAAVNIESPDDPGLADDIETALNTFIPHGPRTIQRIWDRHGQKIRDAFDQSGIEFGGSEWSGEYGDGRLGIYLFVRLEVADWYGEDGKNGVQRRDSLREKLTKASRDGKAE